MDLVLEIADAYCLDQVYATLFPKTGPWLSTMELKQMNSINSISSINSKANFQRDLTIHNDAYGSPFLFPPNDYTFASSLPRDNIIRESISLFLITWVFGYIIYLGVAGLSYVFVFDKENFNHPKFLKNQVRLEISQALSAIPVMTLMTVPWFLGEVRGHSKLYWNVEDYGTFYLYAQFPLFVLFTDMCIYCAHRWLHWPSVYKHLHKPHHKWIIPTPFASHAFHPVDGYVQSLAYHVYPFLFPLHSVAYVLLFGFINFWTVMIHDGEYLARDPIINGSACHTVHHLYFNYNYGQYTTLWDRLGKSHRVPDQELFDKTLKKSKSTWKKQDEKIDKIRQKVEGKDDRVYKK